MRPPWKPRVPTKSAARAVRVVMHARATVRLVTVVVARAARLVPATWHPLMAATNPQKQQVLMHRKLPLSAFAKSPRRPLPLPTVKENKHAATRSPQIPQRAKGP